MEGVWFFSPILYLNRVIHLFFFECLFSKKKLIEKKNAVCCKVNCYLIKKKKKKKKKYEVWEKHWMKLLLILTFDNGNRNGYHFYYFLLLKVGNHNLPWDYGNCFKILLRAVVLNILPSYCYNSWING